MMPTLPATAVVAFIFRFAAATCLLDGWWRDTDPLTSAAT